MQGNKNILVLTYWSYKDALIQTYTLPYVRIIRNIIPGNSEIYLATFENKLHTPTPAESSDIMQRLSDEKICWISHTYTPLGITAYWKNTLNLFRLWRLCISKDITHIHAWCTPAGSIGYILSKLTGIPLIIDSYEPHAEAMVENGTWKKNGLAFKLLFALEKRMSKHARVVIATAAGMKSYAKIKFNTELKSFFVKPACVDLNLFNPAAIAAKKEKGKILCVYAGKFGGIYLQQEVFDFFKVAHTYWGDKFRVLLLTDTSNAEVQGYARAAQLDPDIIICKFAAHKDVALYLAQADFAINPVKPVPTKKFCTSIKDGEYWAMGLPVVIPAEISDDSEIINANGIGAVLTSLNNTAYLEAIQKIDQLIQGDNFQLLKDKIILIAKQYRSFAIAEKVYRSIY